MTPTATPSVIPDDVRTFAAEQGAADYLEPVLDLARQCFPGAPLHVFLEEDMEIAGWWFIVVEVDVTGWDTGRIAAAYDRWTPAFVDFCPPAVRECFVLGWR